MRKVNKITVHNYTLMELLVVIGVLGIFFIATAKFVFEGNRRCSHVSRTVLLNQELSLIKNNWRKFINGCNDKVIFSETPNSIVSGNNSAQIIKNKLVLLEDGKNRELKIPNSLNGKIKLIKKQGFAECFVLEFSYKKRPKVPTLKNDYFRIVACQKEIRNEK